MLFGIHMKTHGGLPATLDRAIALGCGTMQIFTTNPMAWRSSVISADEAAAFRERVKETGFGPVFSHTPYLLNLASANEELRRKSVAALAADLKRAEAIGAFGVVTHLGSRPAEIGERAGVIAGSIDEALEAATVSGVKLLLENSSGSGNIAGASFEELALIRERSRCCDSTGICLDTCHMFAAGYPMSPCDAAEDTLSQLNRTVGIGSLALVHANDSKWELGSRKDRHENIGEGYIGEAGFACFLASAYLSDSLPLIIETPGDVIDDGVRNLEKLKAICLANRPAQA